MSDLFNNPDIIRTLGFYQPFGSLMLHGKIETRWVRKGKKPPFPLGKYVLYTTQTKCDGYDLVDWSGGEVLGHLTQTVMFDDTVKLNGYALCTADLVRIAPMTKDLEMQCFVNFKGEVLRTFKSGETYPYIQQCLYFENVTKIEPFEFAVKGKSVGKQGVGFLPNELYSKIKPIL